MNTRNLLSFELDDQQWLTVNDAMLLAFYHKLSTDELHPLESALAAICAEWSAGRRSAKRPTPRRAHSAARAPAIVEAT